MKRVSNNGQKQLTQREKAFVENVAAGDNQTKAVIKAGYSKKSAKVIGSQIANKAIVQEAIRARKNQAYSANSLCAEMVVGGLNEIAFGPIELLIRDDGSVDLSEAKRLGLMHLIKKIKLTETPLGSKTEVEFYSRMDALKKLADIGQIQLPGQEMQNERIRLAFTQLIERYAASRNISVEESKQFYISLAKRENPECYDSWVRVGIVPPD
jgi:phage terminase small subunit